MRQSNFELLRLLSMLMILGLHANFLALGNVDASVVHNLGVQDFVRTFLECLCIVGVNIFVLISGWFGIKPSVKGICSIIFQVAFYTVLLILATLAAGASLPADFHKTIVFPDDGYWFISAYLMLYILSSALNRFAEQTPAKVFRRVLICFFVAEVVWGYFSDSIRVRGGYHVLSFIGLYLLARYLRLHPSRLTALKSWQSLLLFFLCVGISTVFYFAKWLPSTIAYTAPSVILASVFLLLAFSKMTFTSKAVNWCAASAFAIYLVHCNVLALGTYVSCMSRLCSLTGFWLYVVVAPLVMVAFGLCCICVDKLRGLLWNLLCRIPLLNKFFSISLG